jgi:hypothetical protein
VEAEKQSLAETAHIYEQMSTWQYFSVYIATQYLWYVSVEHDCGYGVSSKRPLVSWLAVFPLTSRYRLPRDSQPLCNLF